MKAWIGYYDWDGDKLCNELLHIGDYYAMIILKVRGLIKFFEESNEELLIFTLEG